MRYCDRALELDPRSAKALARRCRAYVGRHEYAAAEADLARLRGVDPLGGEAAELAALLARTRAADAAKDRELFGRVFAPAAHARG